MIAMPLRKDSSQFVTGDGDRAEPVEIWKARKLIRDHSDGELSLTEIAKSVNLSANYLSEKFKEVTGVNFVRYVGQTRTAKARDLLRNSPNQRNRVRCRLPVVIAIQSGFQKAYAQIAYSVSRRTQKANEGD
jgi:transcriptional regulator GlxA family with amidase domain